MFGKGNCWRPQPPATNYLRAFVICGSPHETTPPLVHCREYEEYQPTFGGIMAPIGSTTPNGANRFQVRDNQVDSQMPSASQPIVESAWITRPADPYDWLDIVRSRALDMLDLAREKSTPEWQTELDRVAQFLMYAQLVYRDLPDGVGGRTQVNGQTILVDTDSFWNHLGPFREIDKATFSNLAAILIHEATHNSGISNECLTDTVPEYVMNKLGLQMAVGYHCGWDTSNPPVRSQARNAPQYLPRAPSNGERAFDANILPLKREAIAGAQLNLTAARTEKLTGWQAAPVNQAEYGSGTQTGLVNLGGRPEESTGFVQVGAANVATGGQSNPMSSLIQVGAVNIATERGEASNARVVQVGALNYSKPTEGTYCFSDLTGGVMPLLNVCWSPSGRRR